MVAASAIPIDTEVRCTFRSALHLEAPPTATGSQQGTQRFFQSATGLAVPAGLNAEPISMVRALNPLLTLVGEGPPVR